MAIDDDMGLIANLIDDIDQIARVGFDTYAGTKPASFLSMIDGLRRHAPIVIW